jgi:hypothetical protein
MGKGHMLFFLNKGAWLERRHRELYEWLTDHWGYRISNIPVLRLDWPADRMLDWTPTSEALAINRERIKERLKL